MWKRVPDDEYIARIRRSIARLDRWRPWFILFYAGMTVVAVWLFLQILHVVIAIATQDNAPLAVTGLCFGIVFGAAFGYLVYGLVHKFVFTLCGYRAERLLIKHIDDQHAQRAEPSQQRDDDRSVNDL